MFNTTVLNPYQTQRLHDLTWHVCLDDNGLPNYIHFNKDGNVYTETAHPEGTGYLLVKIGTWVEWRPVEWSNLQYAKVTIEKEWTDYWSSLLYHHKVQ